MKKWNDNAWDNIIAKYPALLEKPEGVAFCAAAYKAGYRGLAEIRDLAKDLKVRLKFSGASLGSAKVAMGLQKKKSRKGGKPGKGAEARPSKGKPATMLAKVEKKLSIGLDLIQKQMKAEEELSQAKAGLQNLNPSVLTLLAEFDDGAADFLKKEKLI